MRFKARRTRDPFRFSLRGRAAINPYVIVPTVPDDEINRAWDARLHAPEPPAVPDDQPSTARELENILARYFAPGRRQAA
jgi:hypothetical protein